jgi:hypothetical protein
MQCCLGLRRKKCEAMVVSSNCVCPFLLTFFGLPTRLEIAFYCPIKAGFPHVISDDEEVLREHVSSSLTL